MANKTDFQNEVQLLIEGVLESKGVKLTKKESAEIVDGFFGKIKELAIRDGKLQIIGHGNYEVRERAERDGRNPSNGEKIRIPASKSIAFKPAKQLKNI